MGEATKIQWTSHTFNPWSGCTKVAPGCANCYASVDYSVKIRGVKWGPDGNRIRKADSGWKEPLAWDRAAKAAGERRRVFCASLADVFEDWKGPILDKNGDTLHKAAAWQRGEGYIPLDLHIGKSAVTMADLRVDLFRLIDQTPNLDWLLLTKRPENIRRMWGMKADKRPIFPGAPGPLGQPVDCLVADAYRENVWLGTSISDQATADKAVPELMKCRNLSPVLFLSIEPLLGPVDLTRVGNHDGTSANLFDGNCLYVGDIGAEYAWTPRNFLRWVIVGSESGHKRRPMHVEWAMSLREQCANAGVPFFMKQMEINGKITGEISAFPPELQVREFPVHHDHL
jgi:protein gp37